MAKLDKNKTGLVLGAFLASVHAFWSLMVAAIPTQLQKFLDWMFVLHHIKPVYALLAFNIVNAVILVAITFVAGYSFGYVFALIWNRANK